MKGERGGGVRLFGEGRLGLMYWPCGVNMLIRGRALIRKNAAFELSLVKTFLLWKNLSSVSKSEHDKWKLELLYVEYTASQK